MDALLLLMDPCWSAVAFHSGGCELHNCWLFYLVILRPAERVKDYFHESSLFFPDS